MATAYNIAFELGAKLTADFHSTFSQANKEMTRLLDASKKLTSVGKNLTLGVTAPVVGMGAMAVKTFSSFDDSMRNVQAVSGATGEEFAQLTRLAKDLGAQTAWTASQSADAMGYLALAGWDTNQILAATPGLLDLASAASMDLAGAADIVSDVMSAFGMSADKAGVAADMFAQTTRKSNTDVAQLGEALKYAGAAANAAEMDLAQTNAVLGVLADSGIKGSMAGTTVVSMLRDLKKNSKDGQIAVGKTSIALYDQAGSMRDLGSVMADVEKVTKSMTTQQRDAALASVFGTEAMKGANIMLATGSERYKELEDAIRNSEGVAKQMAETLEGGIGGSIRSLLSAIESLAISFGETLAPYIMTAARVLGDFAREISSLPNSVRLIIVVFSMLLAAIGPTLLVTGLLISNTVTVISAFKAARVAVNSLNIATRVYNATQAVATFLMNAQRAAMYGYIFAGGGVRGVIIGISSALRAMNLAFLANPYFIVAAGLALVAFAFYKAWTSSETFRNIVIKSFEVAKRAVIGFAEFMQVLGTSIWVGIVKGAEGIGNLLGAALQSEFANSALMAVGGFIQSVQTGLSSLPGIISMLAPSIATIGLSFLGVSGPVGLVIGAVLSLIGFIYRLSKTNETVANAISTAWAAISTAWAAVSAVFMPFIEVFKAAAEQIAKEIGPEIEKTMQVVSESVLALGPLFAELGATVAELARLIVGMYLENMSVMIDMWSDLATTVIPMVLSILPIVLQVFGAVLKAIAQIAVAVIPIIIELIAAIIPIIVKIIEVVLPLLLNIFMTVFPIILEVIQAVLPIFVSLLTMVIEVIMVLVETALPMILSVVEMVLPVVLGIIQAIIPMIVAVLQILVSVITGIVIPAINAILAVVQVVFPFIEMVISNALAVITGILQAAMALIQSDWSGAWEAIRGIASTIMDNIISFFSSIDLFSVGKSIIDGLINGIKSMASSVVGAISDLVPAPLRGVVSKFIGEIPGFAEGGVVNAPTLAWVGEGGDVESIIPWNNSQRSKDLWLQTGQAIGMLDDGSAGESASDVLKAQSTPTAIESYGVGDNYNTTNNYEREGYIIQIEHKGHKIYVQSGGEGEVARQLEQSDEELYERIKNIIENERRKEL